MTTTSMVNFGVWSNTNRDAVRRKRLAVGYVIGLALSAGLIAAAIVSSKAVAAEREEDIMDVQLATEPEPEPEPEPQPAPEAKKPPPRPKLQTPFEIPKDKPKEVEPAKSDNPYGEQDPFGHDEEPEPVKPEKPIVKEEPKPPPKVVVAPKKPTGPIQITENVTPPVAISNTVPVYPAAAKASGIEGTVVVKYVVTEAGAVTSIQVVRGPPELHEAVIAAMRTWRFKPAMLDGHPVAVSRVQRFPFRIKT